MGCKIICGCPLISLRGSISKKVQNFLSKNKFKKIVKRSRLIVNFRLA